MAESTSASNNATVKFRGKPEREMPLQSGSSPETVSKNISELHTGKTFARTKKKFGKKRANKQAVAIALTEARKSKVKKLAKRGLISESALKRHGA